MFDFLSDDISIQKIGTAIVKSVVVIAVIIYVLMPIDLMPFLPFDDIVVAIVGLTYAGIDIPGLLGASRETRAEYQSKGKKVK